MTYSNNWMKLGRPGIQAISSSSDLWPITLHQHPLVVISNSQHHILKNSEIVKDQLLGSQLKNYSEEERFRVLGRHRSRHWASPSITSNRCFMTSHWLHPGSITGPTRTNLSNKVSHPFSCDRLAMWTLSSNHYSVQQDRRSVGMCKASPQYWF